MEQNNPLVSFIVPVYKVEQYLPQCVDSLLCQQGAPFEVILVDDGSPDGCPALCDAYAAADPRVRVVHQANGGPALARNAGLEAARGVWVSFVDGDDWLEADALACLVKELDETTDVMVFGIQEVSVRQVTPRPFCRAARRFSPEELRQLTLYTFDRFFPVTCCERGFLLGSSCNKLYRRAFLLAHGLAFGQGYHDEDLLFTAQVLCADPRLNGMPAILYNYRQREDSAMRGYKPNARALIEPQVLEVRRFLLKQFPGDEDFARAASMRALTGFLYLMVLDFCHPANPLPYSQRRAAFLAARDFDVFCTALDEKQIARGLPPARRFLTFLCRYRLFFAADLANRLRTLRSATPKKA